MNGNIEILPQNLIFSITFKCLFLLLLFAGIFVLAQKTVDAYRSEKNICIPIYPSGNNSFRNEIAKNFRMDKVKSNMNIYCKLTFVVDIDGSITNIKVAGNDVNFNQEAVYSLKQITQRFIPATIDGMPVRY